MHRGRPDQNAPGIETCSRKRSGRPKHRGVGLRSTRRTVGVAAIALLQKKSSPSARNRQPAFMTTGSATDQRWASRRTQITVIGVEGIWYRRKASRAKVSIFAEWESVTPGHPQMCFRTEVARQKKAPPRRGAPEPIPGKSVNGALQKSRLARRSMLRRGCRFPAFHRGVDPDRNARGRLPGMPSAAQCGF